MNIFKFSVYFSALFLAFSCTSEDNVDTTLPEISSFKINASETKTDDGEVLPIFHHGDNLDLSFSLSDNEGLNEYKINVHLGEEHEGHDHSRLSSDDDKAYAFDHIEDLNGTTASVDWGKTIPENAKEGEYHLHLQVTDLSGNQKTALGHFIIEEEHEEHEED